MEGFISFLTSASSLVPSSLLPHQNDITSPSPSSLLPLSPSRDGARRRMGRFPQLCFPSKTGERTKGKINKACVFLFLSKACIKKSLLLLWLYFCCCDRNRCNLGKKGVCLQFLAAAHHCRRVSEAGGWSPWSHSQGQRGMNEPCCLLAFSDSARFLF